MSMQIFLKKLSSRKFLTCVAGVIMGICMAFGLDEQALTSVSGAVVAVVSIVTYIYTEGKIDAAAVDKIKDSVDKVEDAIEDVNKIEEVSK